MTERQPRPTTNTSSEPADASLWLRSPKQSNGQCTRGGHGPQDPVYHQADLQGGTR
ncbi:glycoside hydrolase family 6 protein [Microbispora sp. H10830]|uniref:glycoside hydrolase family 6 protein n=1 Tax=Microbispora sp. H10830 TaxID=2729109 RepID=UPI0016032949|nr:glycoside hydrolase family 6 protein [Microbispora sp. H10830]